MQILVTGNSLDIKRSSPKNQFRSKQESILKILE